MRKLIQEQQVKLADLVCCGEGTKPFARRRGESPAAMRARLLAMPGLHARGKRTVVVYRRAMARGDVFPPVFVIAMNGEKVLDDGCHRCTAAALRGDTTISAVVIPVVCQQEADMVSELLFNLEEAGASWQERARFAVAMIGQPRKGQ
jgi:hypothetical protein